MSFAIQLTRPLKLIANKGNDQEIIEVPLKDIGDHKIVRNPRFKEDREERLTTFQGKMDQTVVEVDVIYSLGMDGHQVEYFDVKTLPDGWEVYSEPEFETTP